MKGTTRNGFKFDVDEECLDDMELIDALAESEQGSPYAVTTVCNKILGDAQKKRLYAHLRKRDGKVKVSEVFAALEDMLSAVTDKLTAKK